MPNTTMICPSFVRFICVKLYGTHSSVYIYHMPICLSFSLNLIFHCLDELPWRNATHTSRLRICKSIYTVRDNKKSVECHSSLPENMFQAFLFQTVRPILLYSVHHPLIHCYFFLKPISLTASLNFFGKSMVAQKMFGSSILPNIPSIHYKIAHIWWSF